MLLCNNCCFHLVSQDKAASGVLAVNFDRLLEDALGEAALWERLRLVVPGAAVEALAQRDALRKLRIRASTVAHQYNEACT